VKILIAIAVLSIVWYAVGYAHSAWKGRRTNG
jgi:hypothetical protein